MIHITPAIVVEGKYDQIKLSSLVDAPILSTNGFHIFQDHARLDLIRRYAATTGIVILTDSDAAGFKIRGFLKGAITEGKIYHAYIPDVYAKEHRKEKPSAEGKLGVEGMDKKVLIAALTRAGVPVADEPSEEKPDRPNLTAYDLYRYGLSGHSESTTRRKALQKALALPEHLSTKALLDAINTTVTRQEFESVVQEIAPSPATES